MYHLHYCAIFTAEEFVTAYIIHWNVHWKCQRLGFINGTGLSFQMTWYIPCIFWRCFLARSIPKFQTNYGTFHAALCLVNEANQRTAIFWPASLEPLSTRLVFYNIGLCNHACMKKNNGRNQGKKEQVKHSLIILWFQCTGYAVKTFGRNMLKQSARFRWIMLQFTWKIIVQW